MSTCNHDSVDTEGTRFLMIFPMGETICRGCRSRLSLSAGTKWAAWGLLVLIPGPLGLIFDSIWVQGVGTAICVLVLFRFLARAQLVVTPIEGAGEQGL